MARGEDIFCKIEPAFILSERFRRFSSKHQLAYLCLWAAAVDRRDDLFIRDRGGEQALQSICQLTRRDRLDEFLWALFFDRLIEVLDVERMDDPASFCRQNVGGLSAVCPLIVGTFAADCLRIVKFKILYVRAKHSGYKFRASPSGERSIPDQSQRLEVRVITTPKPPAENTTAPLIEVRLVGGSGMDLQSQERIDACDAADEPAAEPQAHGRTPQPVLPVRVGRESAPAATPAAKNGASAVDCPDTPAQRVLRRLAECWPAVRSALPALARRGVDDPAAVAEAAIRLQAETPGRDEAAALVAMAHYLEALDDPTARSPLTVALHRARSGKPLRTDALAKLRRLLMPGAAAAQAVRFEPEEYTCADCGKTAIWSRSSPGDHPPELCSACALAAGMRMLEQEQQQALEG